MIKEVEALPVTQKTMTGRSMLREDLEYAIAHRIKTFEFEGDYNYKYLAGYAREEANKYFYRNVYWPAARSVEKKLKDVHRFVFCNSRLDYRGQAFKIVSKKREDRIHVYCAIDFDFLDNFESILESDTRKSYKEAE